MLPAEAGVIGFLFRHFLFPPLHQKHCLILTSPICIMSAVNSWNNYCGLRQVNSFYYTYIMLLLLSNYLLRDFTQLADPIFTIIDWFVLSAFTWYQGPHPFGCMDQFPNSTDYYAAIGAEIMGIFYYSHNILIHL